MANNHLLPRLVPDHFVFNKPCQIAAIYQEPLGQGLQDGISLMFSGGPPDAAPKRVVPERVDSRTLLFNTPVYNKMPPSESVSVLPILFTKSRNGHGNEQIDLPSFQIRVQDPTRSLIETSIDVFTQEDLLPVLIMFMLHHKGEQTPFKDERFDKVMTCLIENRDVQSSTSIRDIILPGKKWQRMNIHDFCIEHNLPHSTKASKPLKEGRRLRARSRQETSSSVQDLHSIYSNVNRHRSPILDDVVYDTPDITTNTKKNSASSLVGEPIDRENPPAHFLYPPGSESDMSDTYSDSRLFARSTQSEDDKPSMTGTFKQQQRFSDSDSALNKMSDHTAHAMRDQRKDRNYSSGLHSPSTTRSPLFLSMDANSGNTATLYNITANAPPTLTSRRDTPIPVPRSTQPQGQLSPITSSDNERPMGQQLTVGQQQRPIPRPRQNTLAKQNKTPPPDTSDHDSEDLYDDIVHLSRDLSQDQTPCGARQPPLVAKKRSRQS